jgi:hypothetical protein
MQTSKGGDPVDFLRLAVREARRNATRTQVAILAVALAAATPVLARVIPEGYPTGFGTVERAFVGGDVVVWTAPAPVDSRSTSRLTWLPWNGQDWQSDALYFLPGLQHKGYLAESPGSTWRPTSLEAVKTSLKGVPGITEVRPYLTLPCIAETRHGSFEVILRGRGPEIASEFTMDGFVKVGRALTLADQGEYTAVVPFQGWAWESCDVNYAIPFSLVVPGLVANSSGNVGGDAWGVQAFGLSWDKPLRLAVLPVGGYEVQTGEVQIANHDPARMEFPLMAPAFWDRSEVVVTEETFLRMVSQALGAPAPAAGSFPVYQVSLRAGRMSDLKSTVDLVRRALGSGFAVYSVPELLRTKGSDVSVPVISRDLWPAFLALVFGLSGVIVSGSVYILLAQQRRKIGLLRVIGARRRDIVVYALGVTLYVTLAGAILGFLAGKILSASVVVFSDLSFPEWLARSARELGMTLGLSLSVTLALGTAVGIWASGIPSAEVLRRE